MILKYDLSGKNLALLGLGPDEKLFYCVPYDIAADGRFLTDSYMAVTDRRLIVTYEGTIAQVLNLNDVDEVIAEPLICCGVLMYRQGEDETVLVRYSSKHLSRFSYVARGCRLLKEGETEPVQSDESEHNCPKCGRVLPGTQECPYCAKKKKGLLHDMWQLMKVHKGMLVITALLMLAATAVTLFGPALQKVLVDDVIGSENGTFGGAATVLAGMFALNFGIVFVNSGKYFVCSKLGTSISMDIRRKLYAKIQILSLSFINDRRPGELMNRVINDSNRVKDFMSDVFCDLVTVGIIFVFDVLYMLYLNWKLALIAFAFIPVSIILSVSFHNFIHRRFHMQWVKDDNVHSNLQDVISGMAVVKSYGKEEDEARRFNATADDYADFQRRNETFWAIFFPGLQFIMSVGTYFITFFGGRGVLDGTMTAGELIQFVSYATMLYQYIGWLTNLPRRLMHMVTALERINDVMNQTPRIVDRAAIRHDIEGKVEFEHASFGYKSFKPVLEDINLSVKPGEMIGLVGASGTGKSTLINLIMHLYEVDNGRILVDGIDIRDIAIENYHAQIGVVLQETFLFSGTILNNIKFAKPDATYEEVITAAKMANAHDFICRTPDGYNTYVGEKGFNLSGGERQRIAIARAILNNPRLLILDEATASLDTESEYLIQKALERLTSGRTTFAIAHRLSTLKDADRLVVIDGHHIAEVGTHNELMEKQGIYFGLVNAQLEMNAAAKKVNTEG